MKPLNIEINHNDVYYKVDVDSYFVERDGKIIYLSWGWKWDENGNCVFPANYVKLNGSFAVELLHNLANELGYTVNVKHVLST